MRKSLMTNTQGDKIFNMGYKKGIEDALIEVEKLVDELELNGWIKCEHLKVNLLKSFLNVMQIQKI